MDVAARLKRLYGVRKDLTWGLARLAEYEHDIMNADELLRLSERTLVAPLDPYARGIVAASAKRVSVVTAVSPGALIDMLFVGTENLRMLRTPIPGDFWRELKSRDLMDRDAPTPS